MQQPIRVVVADDHPVILFGAEHALLDFPGIQVVGRARQSTELVKALQTVPCDTESSLPTSSPRQRSAPATSSSVPALMAGA